MDKYILIGVGGTGSHIVNGVYGRISPHLKPNFAAFCIDTDHGDLKRLHNITASNRIQFTPGSTSVEDIFMKYPKKDFSFFEKHRSVMQNNIDVGAGQVRQVSRLAYESIDPNNFNNLLNTIGSFYAQLVGHEEAHQVRVIIAGSICGGTGSGSILQLAFSIKTYIATTFGRSAIINFLTLLPGIYTETSDLAKQIKPSQKQRIKANAYSFLREWKTFNDAYYHKFTGDPEDLEMYVGSFNGSKFKITKDDISQNDIDGEVVSKFKDPINYFYLIGSVSSDGLNYRTSRDYTRAAEDFLYYLCTTSLAAEGLSRLDNLLAELWETGGYNRFAGVGCARIVYPKNRIEELASIVFYEESLGKNWFQIDNDYSALVISNKKKHKLGDQQYTPKFKDYFTNRFDQLAETNANNNFFGILQNELSYTERDSESGSERSRELYKDFLVKLNVQLEELTFAVKNDNGDSLISNFSTKINSYLESLDSASDKVAIVQSIEKAVNLFEIFSKRYTEISTNINTISNYFFNLENDDNLDRANALTNPYNLAFYLVRDNQVLHPLTQRYFIYKVIKELRRRKLEILEYTPQGDTIGELPGIISSINQIRKLDYLPSTDIKEDPMEAITTITGEQSVINKIAQLFKRDFEEFKSIYVKGIEKEKKNLIRQFQLTIELKVLDKLLSRLEQFASLQSKYFKDLQIEINNNLLEARKNRLKKSAFESNPSYTEVFDDSVDLMNFISDKIQNYAPEEGVKDLEDETNEMLSNILFDKFRAEIFDAELNGTVVDVNAVETKYSDITEEIKFDIQTRGIFDLNIVDAIREEGRIKGSQNVDAYFKRIIKSAGLSASPMIDVNRDIGDLGTLEYWNINSNVFETLELQGVENIFGTDTSILEAGQGLDVDLFSQVDTDISKYELVKNNINFGFSPDNLSDFTCRPELGSKNLFSEPIHNGDYFNAYNKECLDIWTNKESPIHLDRKWSNPTVLSPLTIGVNELYRSLINKAYLIGCNLRLFKYDDKRNVLSWTFSSPFSDERKILKSESKESNLSFLHLYNSLADNMDVVFQIIGYKNFQSNYIGILEQIHKIDQKKNTYSQKWRDYTFVKNLVSTGTEIYAAHPNTNYNILDCILGIVDRGNNGEKDFALVSSLLKSFGDLVIEYHEEIYGERVSYVRRFQEFMKELIVHSTFAKKASYYKDRRPDWKAQLMKLGELSALNSFK